MKRERPASDSRLLEALVRAQQLRIPLGVRDGIPAGIAYGSVVDLAKARLKGAWPRTVVTLLTAQERAKEK